MSILWYHGTDKQAADSIMKSGFKAQTYFTDDMGNALEMGGDYIFQVLFDEKPSENWQWRTPVHIPPERISSLVVLKAKELYYSKKIWRLMKKESQPENTIFCEECQGQGQTDNYSRFTRWGERDKCTVCKKCNGRGYIKRCPGYKIGIFSGIYWKDKNKEIEKYFEKGEFYTKFWEDKSNKFKICYKETDNTHPKLKNPGFVYALLSPLFGSRSSYFVNTFEEADNIAMLLLKLKTTNTIKRVEIKKKIQEIALEEFMV